MICRQTGKGAFSARGHTVVLGVADCAVYKPRQLPGIVGSQSVPDLITTRIGLR
jgi:hypothetical protein